MSSDTAPQFSALKIHDNPDGWGPPLDLPPEKFRDMPYASFSKSDRLGRAADWTSSRFSSRDEEGDDSVSAFIVVDNRQQRTNPFPGYRKLNFRSNTYGNRKRTDGTYRNLNKKNDTRRGINQGPMNRRPIRHWSVDIDSSWEQVIEFTFSNLSKTQYKHVDKGETILACGTLETYDKTNDRISTKVPKSLERFEHRAFHYVTTTDDPKIREFASRREANVFATGTLLAYLTTATRSANSWDIVVQRVGDCLFFDKRETSEIDFETVNETASDPPRDDKDELNSLRSLSLEATLINQNFSQAVLDHSKTKNLKEPNPFAEDETELASVGYLYRKWEISEDITLIARCEVDCAVPDSNGDEYMVVKALNEYIDTNQTRSVGSEWRAKLDTQRGAVLATELKNNSAKLARWTAQALLADASQLKLGFVSRVNPKDNANHVILGTQLYKPKEFAAQIALNFGNMWGIFKTLVDACYKRIDSGCKGIIVKDPNQSVLRLYKVPDDAFDDETDGVDNEEGQEEGEEEVAAQDETGAEDADAEEHK